MKMRKIMMLLVALSLILVLAACGSGSNDGASSDPAPAPSTNTSNSGGTDSGSNNEKNEEPEKPKEPYTMVIYSNSGFQPADFDHMFRERIEEKFPHITFEYIMRQTGATIQDLAATGNIPDIIRTDIPTLKADFIDMGLAYDMTDLVNKYNYDLDQFEDSFVQEIIDYVGTGELYGIPVPPYYGLVLYYNKGLFDAFGVEYPRDGMTWDEVYELAKVMTRSDGDQMYRGFNSHHNSVLRDNQLSHPILDPEKDGLADMDTWAKIFQNLKRFYDIPGNQPAADHSAESNQFNEGNVALYAFQFNMHYEIDENIDWDLVSYPLMEGAPKVGGQRGPAYWSITQQSEHKDEAMEVIMEMLHRDNQLRLSKEGVPTVLKDEEVRKALGSENPKYIGKNTMALYYHPAAEPTPKRKPGLVDVPGRTQELILRTAFWEVVTEGKDINTALREADEKLKQELEVQAALEN